MAEKITNVRVKHLEDIILHETPGNIDKDKVYAKIVEIDGETYFKAQIKIQREREDQSTETEGYADIRHDETDRTILVPNTYYEQGSFIRLEYKPVDKVSVLTLVVLADAKAPGGTPS